MHKHIVIIAGEESGDQHAASFVRQLKLKHPHLQLSGIGGQHMEKEGVQLISDLARFGVTGLSAILRHARVIRRAFKDIKVHLRTVKPDLLILVDYPGFNLRLAKFAKKELGIRILYYISPQIWAWKAGRIHTIKNCIDHMAVILPFEKTIYEAAGVPVSFVGHPLVNQMSKSALVRETLSIPIDKRCIAMLPGSRLGEIERHMPVLVKTAEMLYEKFPDLHFLIPVASTIDPKSITAYFEHTSLPFTLTHGQAVETVALSDCAIVASGTASLECALLEKPMCIIYKSGLLSYVIALKVIKIKYLGLCNLLKNKMIVPELLQYDCNPVELTRTVMQLLSQNSMLERMQDNLRQLRLSLTAEQADCTISSLIEQQIS